MEPYSADAYLNLSKANNLLGDYNSAIEAALNAVKYAYKNRESRMHTGKFH